MHSVANLFSSLLLLLLLELHLASSKSRNVRRARNLQFYDDESPPLVAPDSMAAGGPDDESPPLVVNGFGNSEFDSSEPVDINAQDQAIRNGFDIPPIPWFIVFQGGTLCGGSLIHGDIVLTAAHCVDDNGLPPRVRVGASNYYFGGIETDVVDGVLHPDWSWSRSSDPDLAVLKLRDFLPNQVAILNEDDSIPTANHPSVFAMGFGLINDEDVSQSLKGASIPYINDCRYLSYSYNRTRHICADSRHIATCGGDSGAPVTLGMGNNLQVGINSYSNGKCSSQTLDVYTRVSFFADWIKHHVCALSKRPPEYCFTLAPTDAATTIAPTELASMEGSGETMDPSSLLLTDVPTDFNSTEAPTTEGTELDGASAT